MGGIALKSLATEATYRRSAGQGSIWAGWNAFMEDHKTSSATTLGYPAYLSLPVQCVSIGDCDELVNTYTH